MGKKAKHPEHENLERWLVSYADFITLLFATFTALYAIATAELANMEDVAKAIRASFEQQSLMHGIASLFDGESSSTDKQTVFEKETGKGEGVMGQYERLLPSPGDAAAVQATLETLEKTVQPINEAIKEMNDQATTYRSGEGGEEKTPAVGPASLQQEDGIPLRGVEVAVQERGVRVSFDSRLLFLPGTATLAPESRQLLNTLIERLRPHAANHIIQVEGHTDNQRITSAQYPSNWELSTARAATVVRAMIQKGYQPNRLAAVGYAETRPVASNASAKGRAENRRIDIMLLHTAVGNQSDPAHQLRREKKVLAAPAASMVTPRSPSPPAAKVLTGDVLIFSDQQQ